MLTLGIRIPSVFKGELLSLATISKVDFGFVVFIPICEKMEKLFKKILIVRNH